MSYIVNTYAEQNRLRHRTKKLSRFVNSGNAQNLDYRSTYVLEKHSKTKHICISCLTAEVRLNSRGLVGSQKHCQPCYDKLPLKKCLCGNEFKIISKYREKCNSCYDIERNKSRQALTKETKCYQTQEL